MIKPPHPYPQAMMLLHSHKASTSFSVFQIFQPISLFLSVCAAPPKTPPTQATQLLEMKNLTQLVSLVMGTTKLFHKTCLEACIKQLEFSKDHLVMTTKSHITTFISCACIFMHSLLPLWMQNSMLQHPGICYYLTLALRRTLQTLRQSRNLISQSINQQSLESILRLVHLLQLSLMQSRC